MPPKKQLSLFDLSMIVISLVIGMGIFRTPVNVAAAAQIPELFFIAWIIGGAVALCGALTYAEIGSRFPVTGGYYKIFSAFYHPSIAFAINCIIVVSNAASVAGVSIIGAEYLSKIILPAELQTEFSRIVVAAITIVLFYVVNLLGLKVSSKTQNVLSMIKISMVLILLCSIFVKPAPLERVAIKDAAVNEMSGTRDRLPIVGTGTSITDQGTQNSKEQVQNSKLQGTQNIEPVKPITNQNSAVKTITGNPEKATFKAAFGTTPDWMDYGKALGICLIAVSFTFGGYQQTINFGGETKQANKVIPRAIITGLVIIIVLYMGINYAYVKVIGFEQLKTAESIAAILAGTLFGPAGFTLLSCLVFLSVLGYVNVNLLSNPRVMYAMGQEGALPRMFSKKTKKNEVMVVSLTVFAIISVFTLFYAQTFDKILNYTIFLDCIGMATSAATIFFLRKRTAHLDKKTIYSMSLYPLMPLIFIATYSFVGFSIYLKDPEAGRNGLFIFGGFIIIYFINRFFNPLSTNKPTTNDDTNQ